MTDRLSPESVAAIPPNARPPIAPADLSTGIVHIGLGAFHRAHQAVFTQDAIAATGDTSWGIAGVAPHSRGTVDALRAQGGLYTVLERDGDAAIPRVVGVHTAAVHAPSTPHDVLAGIAVPATRVVTLTVTEKGYRADQAGRLLMDEPTRADLAGGGPSTVLGLLVGGLAARMRADAGPIAVACCDNLRGNGGFLRRIVLQYAQQSTGGPALCDWIGGHVGFPTSVVDRIVPATTDRDGVDTAALLGCRDDAVVVAEPFRQWVITEDFPAGRPAWERAGAVFTEDVTAYEECKLRSLNATHSMLAYLGLLCGYTYIADAVGDSLLGEAARAFLAQDVTPTLRAPEGLDLAAYQRNVLHRFGNAALGHRADQVGSDGSQKLPVRLVPVVRDRLAAGAAPRWSALLIAAWLRVLVTGQAQDGTPVRVHDPMAAEVARRCPAAVSGDAAALLRIGAIFGDDLADNAELGALIDDHLASLARHGVRATVAGLLGG